MPIVGIVQGMQPIIGYNYGAKLQGRVTQTVKLGLVVSTVIASIVWVVTMGIPELLINIFSNDDSVLANGTNALRLIFLLAPIIGFQIVTGGLYQALGKAKTSLMLSMSRQLLFLIPIVLTLPHLYGLEGVWMSFPIADVLAFLFALIILLKDRKMLFSNL
nr:MATE family efflux transporter [Desulfoscipio geothermicus]